MSNNLVNVLTAIRWTILFFVLCALNVHAIAPAVGEPIGKQPSLLKTIADCASVSPLSKDGVEKVLGIKLKKVPPGSNRPGVSIFPGYASYYTESLSATGFKSVDFSMTSDPKLPDRRDLDFVLMPGQGVTLSQLEKAFGAPTDLMPRLMPHRIPPGEEYVYQCKSNKVVVVFDSGGKRTEEISITTVK